MALAYRHPTGSAQGLAAGAAGEAGAWGRDSSSTRSISPIQSTSPARQARAASSSHQWRRSMAAGHRQALKLEHASGLPAAKGPPGWEACTEPGWSSGCWRTRNRIPWPSIRPGPHRFPWSPWIRRCARPCCGWASAAKTSLKGLERSLHHRNRLPLLCLLPPHWRLAPAQVPERLSSLADLLEAQLLSPALLPEQGGGLGTGALDGRNAALGRGHPAAPRHDRRAGGTRRVHSRGAALGPPRVPLPIVGPPWAAACAFATPGCRLCRAHPAGAAMSCGPRCSTGWRRIWSANNPGAWRAVDPAGSWWLRCRAWAGRSGPACAAASPTSGWAPACRYPLAAGPRCPWL